MAYRISICVEPVRMPVVAVDERRSGISVGVDSNCSCTSSGQQVERRLTLYTARKAFTSSIHSSDISFEPPSTELKIVAIRRIIKAETQEDPSFILILPPIAALSPHPKKRQDASHKMLPTLIEKVRMSEGASVRPLRDAVCPPVSDHFGANFDASIDLAVFRRFGIS